MPKVTKLKVTPKIREDIEASKHYNL